VPIAIPKPFEPPAPHDDWLHQVASDAGLSDFAVRLAAVAVASLPAGSMSGQVDLSAAARGLERSQRALDLTIRELVQRGHLMAPCAIRDPVKLRLLVK